MGASSSISIQYTREECADFVGPLLYDDKLFERFADRSSNKISMSSLSTLLSQMTDVFLTHDWGKEEGQDNHERVSRINRALQAKGLRTWFDADKMTGNVKKQMTDGIASTKCVLVFITRRYMDKVDGTNAEDNCQLEFNFACQQKTGNKMVSVVMEERARDTKYWFGPVGMTLGSRLYVDMVDDSKFEENMNNLYNEILITINKPLNEILSTMEIITDSSQIKSENSPTVPKTMHIDSSSTNSIKIADFSLDEVCMLLEFHNFQTLTQIFRDNEISGTVLTTLIDSVKDFTDIGIKPLQAKSLFAHVVEWKTKGLSLEAENHITNIKNIEMEKVAAKLAKEEEERLEREKLKQEEEKNFELANMSEKEIMDHFDLAEKYNNLQSSIDAIIRCATCEKATNKSLAEACLALLKYEDQKSNEWSMYSKKNTLFWNKIFDTDYKNSPSGQYLYAMRFNTNMKVSADNGYAPAQYSMSKYYLEEKWYKDETKSISYTQLAAAQDYAPAQYDLGKLYEYLRIEGTNRDTSNKLARKYYTLSANQGYYLALYALAQCYEAGKCGITKDHKEALRYYILAATTTTKPHDVSMYYVACCYEHGYCSVEVNFEEAMRYYILAGLQHSHKEALLRLLLIYRRGYCGVTKDQKEADKYYKLAISKGFTEANSSTYENPDVQKISFY